MSCGGRDDAEVVQAASDQPGSGPGAVGSGPWSVGQPARRPKDPGMSFLEAAVSCRFVLPVAQPAEHSNWR
jgi:hypothetical protein